MSRITAKEAAQKLGVTDARIRQMILEGKLPAEKFGSVLSIDESDLNLVADRKVGRPRKEPAAEASQVATLKGTGKRPKRR